MIRCFVGVVWLREKQKKKQIPPFPTHAPLKNSLSPIIVTHILLKEIWTPIFHNCLIIKTLSIQKAFTYNKIKKKIKKTPPKV